jgi:F0F1-type ATP synthase membrane subunit c/vacuolar-type H+-ATPase subunit K
MTVSNEQKEPESNEPKTQSYGYWIAIGLAIGAGIGVALDNLAIGVSIGLAIGVALSAVQSQRNKNK